MGYHLLSILVFLPTIGAALTLFVKGRDQVRRVALGTTLGTFLLSLAVLGLFKWGGATSGSGGYAYADQAGVVQMVEQARWIPAFHVQYKLGIDGLSLPLILLTTFISVLACVASWNVDRMTQRYFALFLFLETAVLGTFCSLDLFLFYVFFEVSLLPTYFLIGVWGGPRREYAAIKFFLFTLLGSIGLLIVLIGTYLYSKQVVPGGTFDLVRLASPEFHAKLAVAMGGGAGTVAKTFFVLALVGFLIKLPAVPLHTWLPDAQVEAPTPCSMILVAVLLKLGGYGLFRVAYPLFPEAAKALWMPVALTGVVSIIYGALCAMAQSDFKRLLAYSSVSHMGFVVLGAAMMTDAAMNGALFMMVAHGITSAMTCFVVGVLHDRARHSEIARLGGLAGTMPTCWGLSTVAFLANLGLPGLCGFIGQILVLIGTFAAARDDSVLRRIGATPKQIYPLAVIACLGIVLTAAYTLWTMQRAFFGPEKPEYQSLPDLDARELVVLTPLAVMCVLLGVLPTVLFFTFTGQTVSGLLKIFG